MRWWRKSYDKYRLNKIQDSYLGIGLIVSSVFARNVSMASSALLRGDRITVTSSGAYRLLVDLDDLVGEMAVANGSVAPSNCGMENSLFVFDGNNCFLYFKF